MALLLLVSALLLLGLRTRRAPPAAVQRA
jgi:hypothetical protein